MLIAVAASPQLRDDHAHCHDGPLIAQVDRTQRLLAGGMAAQFSCTESPAGARIWIHAASREVHPPNRHPS